LAGKPTDTKKCPADITCWNFKDVVRKGEEVSCDTYMKLLTCYLGR
jgi:hypothetical protein